MRVVIFGAAGFIGRSLVRCLAQDPRIDAVTLVDRVDPSVTFALPALASYRVGDLADAEMCRQAMQNADGAVILASVLGGAAEHDYALARKINVDATLTLFEAMRDASRPRRVVFTSSIAVYGTELPTIIDDATPARPEMVYAAQKLMMEIALSNFNLRGSIDGFALRVPGIVARPDGDRRLKSAFLSNLFYAVRDGRDLELPVEQSGATWLMSAGRLAENLRHALFMPNTVKQDHCSVLLPCLRVTFAKLVEGLYSRYPRSRSRITYAPDPVIHAQFGNFPELDAALGKQLGFVAEESVEELLKNALPSGSGASSEGALGH